MAKFNFRLQRVLDYRADQEDAAKRVYQNAVAERIETEAQIDAIIARRNATMGRTPDSISGRLALETHVFAVDAQVETLRSVLNVLADEEEQAREKWLQCRQDRKALGTLRDKELEEWTLNESRREQADLDEWAVLRR